MEQVKDHPELFARVMEEFFGLHETWTTTEQLLADETTEFAPWALPELTPA